MANAFIEGWYEKNHERYTEEIENVLYEWAYAAQKYLIEKACEWLEGTLRMYAGYSDTADLVDSFRKAMEEYLNK